MDAQKLLQQYRKTGYLSHEEAVFLLGEEHPDDIALRGEAP